MFFVLGTRKKTVEMVRNLGAIFVMALFLLTPLWALADSRSWSFDNASEYTLSDSGKIEVNTTLDVARLKVDGAPSSVWERWVDQSASDQAHGVAVDSNNNIIVTGEVLNGALPDYYTVKYNSSGTLLWAKQKNVGYDQAWGVAVDSSDNIIIAGGAGANFHTLKYDANGNELWERSYDGGGFDSALGVAVDTSDNIIVTGSLNNFVDGYTIKYDSSGNTLWDEIYDSGDDDLLAGIGLDSSGNPFISMTISYPAANDDARLIKYNGSNGSLLWSETYTGIGPSSTAASGRGTLGVDSSNNVIWQGSVIDSDRDWFVFKYNSFGGKIWEKFLDDTGDDRAAASAVDSFNDIVVTGDTGGPGARDWRTIKYDSSGNVIWQKSYAGSGASIDYSTGVAIDSYDADIVAGVAVGGGSAEDYLTIKYPMGAFDTASPTAINNNTQAFNRLDSFAETPGSKNQGDLSYQISQDGGVTWRYFDGSSWQTASGGVAQSNTASVVNTNLSSFDSPPYNTGSFKFRSFFTSNGQERTELSNLDLGYTTDVTPPSDFSLQSPGNDEHVDTTKPVFIWQAPSDTGVGLWKYQLFIDNSLVQDNIAPSGGATDSYTLGDAQALAEGDHGWYIKAFDGAGNEKNSSQTFTVNIDTVNDQPVLIADIPDQSWDEDTVLADAFDLDDYFEDRNPNDSITYSVAGDANPAHIDVSINASNTVTLESNEENWTGTEQIVFVATDTLGGLSTRSNTVNLTVNPVNDKPTPPTTFSPAGGQTVYTVLPTLAWDGASDREDDTIDLAYQIRLGTFSDPQDNYNRDYQTSTGQTSFTLPKNLTDLKDYYYVIRTIDSEGGESDWSAVQSFHIDTSQKDVLVLTKAYSKETGGLASFTNFAGSLGFFTTPRDLLYLALIFFLLYLAYLFYRLYPEKKNFLATLSAIPMALLRQAQNGILTVYYLAKHPSKAFAYVYNYDQGGTWQGSYQDFKRNRRIGLYVMMGLALTIFVEVLFAQMLPGYYPQIRAATTETVLPGETMTFQIAYENTGSHKLEDISFTDSLSASLVYRDSTIKLNGSGKTDSAGDDEASVSGSTITITLPELDPGAKGSFTFEVKAKETIKQNTSVTNVASVAYNPGKASATSNILHFNAEASGEISGYIFEDANRNGLKDNLEAGLSGATVKLYTDHDEDGVLDDSDSLTAIATTASSGYYDFQNVSAGFYLIYVEESTVPGYRLSSHNNPGQAVLTTSLSKYNDADFGFVSIVEPVGGPGETEVTTTEEVVVTEEVIVTEETEETPPEKVIEGVVNVLKKIEDFLFPKKEGERSVVEAVFTPIIDGYQKVLTSPTIQRANKSFIVPATIAIVTGS
ncbi:isopeptide-forming domain-containing fimbrial protein, partial [Patescibacteria group bacterium]|nr:isopeptide-forming domain-containing fimbrial protein [Patescibacteria group bacterium]